MHNHELKALLEKYITGDCTMAEKEHLAAAIGQPGQSDEILDEFVRETLGSEVFDGPEDPAVRAAIFAHLDAHMHPVVGGQRVGRVRSLGGWQYAAAAAALIIFVTGGWWFLKKHDGSAPAVIVQQLPNDVPPGHEGAILTLADGHQVVLDSTGNGQVTTQGHVRVSRKNTGELTYQADGVKESAVVYNTLSTPRGRKISVTLADGTRVWLNAASSIRYPTAFTGKERAVTVSGEAFFDVAKDPAQPFVVETMAANGQAPVRVEVLGTSFNISAYPDEASVSTTLVDGSVKLVTGTQSLAMTPGQQGISTPNSELRVNAHVDVQKITAWKDDVFLFKGDELPAVMKQLSRWYDIEVVFDGNVSDHYTGRISRKVNISQVLHMLEAAGGVKFSVQNKQVKVLRAAM